MSENQKNTAAAASGEATGDEKITTLENPMPAPPKDGAAGPQENPMPSEPAKGGLTTMENPMPAPPALDRDGK
ncbi:sigma-like protein [Streptomyces sp. HMX87]|uniref:sigma-like protein n=1 Tax=Streptomyces sp. HMX87 TaxID=3390849 RepID=UPI003A8A735D